MYFDVTNSSEHARGGQIRMCMGDTMNDEFRLSGDCYGRIRCGNDVCLRCFALKRIEPLISALENDVTFDKRDIQEAMWALIIYSRAIRCMMQTEKQLRRGA